MSCAGLPDNATCDNRTTRVEALFTKVFEGV